MVSTIDKDALAKLPIEVFGGNIIIVQKRSEVKAACEYLNKFDLLGFDSETRPSFKKGVTNKISLIQLSSEDTCVLFRLNKIGMPDCLTKILTNPEIRKIGLSVRDDFNAIRRRKSLIPANFLDLQVFVKQFGIDDSSLQRIYGILFGKKISKGQRLSNWDAENLSEAQKKYAALDAWACLRIYSKLNDIKKTE